MQIDTSLSIKNNISYHDKKKKNNKTMLGKIWTGECNRVRCQFVFDLIANEFGFAVPRKNKCEQNQLNKESILCYIDLPSIRTTALLALIFDLCFDSSCERRSLYPIIPYITLITTIGKTKNKNVEIWNAYVIPVCHSKGILHWRDSDIPSPFMET